MRGEPYSLEKTQELAAGLAKKFKAFQQPRVLALVGDLGSGKTTFAAFLAQSLGIKRRLLSPTFVISRHYQFEIKKQTFTLFHLDLYRLEESGVKYLGLEDFLNEKNSLLMIEWAEKALDLLPKDTLWINFKYLSPEEREITFSTIDNIF